MTDMHVLNLVLVLVHEMHHADSCGFVTMLN
eukprot:SAG11_NODE_20318_length_448_cov_0.739255_2_plen_30_part_01